QNGKQRNTDGKNEDRLIDAEVKGSYPLIVTKGGVQDADAPRGQEQPKARAGDGNEDIFGKELPDQAPAPRTQRRTYGDFVLTSGAARQQQTGDVGASNHQHQTYAPHQQHD